jgi:hypothetical protein
VGLKEYGVVELGAWFRGLFRSKSSDDFVFGRTGTLPAIPVPVADDANDFALGLYARLRQRPGNLFFSPISNRQDPVSRARYRPHVCWSVI